MAAIITMNEATSLLRLMAWLSPVFPTGGFAYSSGLEAAVRMGRVVNQADLEIWLDGLLQQGALKNEAIFLAHAWCSHTDVEAINELTELALSMAGSSERYLETTAQAGAFTTAVKNWPEITGLAIPDPCTLPIAIGMAAGASRLNLSQTLLAYLQSVVSNQTQAAIRLSIIGQTAAAEVLARLEASVANTADFAENARLDALGSATVTAEIAAMQHETLPGRMFRS